MDIEKIYTHEYKIKKNQIIYKNRNNSLTQIVKRHNRKMISTVKLYKRKYCINLQISGT